MSGLRAEQETEEGHIFRGKVAEDDEFTLEFRGPPPREQVTGTLNDLGANIDDDLINKMRAAKGDWVMFPRAICGLLYDKTKDQFTVWWADRTDGGSEPATREGLRQAEHEEGAHTRWISDAMGAPGTKVVLTGARDSAAGDALNGFGLDGAPDVVSQSPDQCLLNAVECLLPVARTSARCIYALSQLGRVNSATANTKKKTKVAKPLVNMLLKHKTWFGVTPERMQLGGRGLANSKEFVDFMVARHVKGKGGLFVVWVEKGTHCVAVDATKGWIMDTCNKPEFRKPFRLCPEAFEALGYEILTARELVPLASPLRIGQQQDAEVARQAAQAKKQAKKRARDAARAAVVEPQEDEVESSSDGEEEEEQEVIDDTDSDVSTFEPDQDTDSDDDEPEANEQTNDAAIEQATRRLLDLEDRDPQATLVWFYDAVAKDTDLEMTQPRKKLVERIVRETKQAGLGTEQRAAQATQKRVREEAETGSTKKAAAAKRPRDDAAGGAQKKQKTGNQPEQGAEPDQTPEQEAEVEQAPEQEAEVGPEQEAEPEQQAAAVAEETELRYRSSSSSSSSDESDSEETCA